MQRLAYTTLFIAMASIAQSQTIDELMTNPYWTVGNYQTGYCLHRDAFYADAAEREIEVDETDAAIEVYLRESFDLMLMELRVQVIGQRPDREEFICS